MWPLDFEAVLKQTLIEVVGPKRSVRYCVYSTPKLTEMNKNMFEDIHNDK